MTYKSLSPSLHATADAARAFFKERMAVKCVIEKPIRSDINFTTTLHGITKDYHYLCVEVSENSYTDTLDAFVLECKNKCLPVKLYVAMPKGVSDGKFKMNLQRATSNGVGIIELDQKDFAILRDPLPLSLTGVHLPDFRAFLPKYRAPLHEAYSTFRNGNPAKGCATVYDEIEGLCRRIGKKADARAYWTSVARGGVLNFDKDAWATVVEYLLKYLDSAKTKCPDLNKPLYNRILGITDHRNDTGHKPPSVDALVKRDRELRTRFEHATDILRELAAASSGIRP